jgi:hypothetical protein
MKVVPVSSGSGRSSDAAEIVASDHQLAGGELADRLFLSELVGHRLTLAFYATSSRP